MKRKWSFLLLEVLIALSILIATLAYLIRDPYMLIKREFDDLCRLEERRLWRVRLMDIEDKLPTQAPTLSEQRKTESFPITIFLPGGGKKTYNKSYYLYRQKAVEGSDGTMYYKIRVKERLDTDERPATDRAHPKNVQDGVYEYFVAVPSSR